MRSPIAHSHVADRLSAFLYNIAADTQLRARLLNTLSYMEHIGATKIARSQAGPTADFITLKHAAEEARHAFYLKKLCLKVAPLSCPDYTHPHLLAPIPSRQYLYRLDLAASRLCANAGLSGTELRKLAYLLVTYAIEVRADMLYPVLEKHLDEWPERISVASIIAEEEGHLAEMETALAAFPPHLQNLTQDMLQLEEDIHLLWMAAIEEAIALPIPN